MKKLLLLSIVTFVFGSSTVFARGVDIGGNLTLGDGSNILRINIGDEKTTDRKSMAKRMKRLERAVRDLQNRIYDLEDSDTTETPIWFCTAEAFGKVYTVEDTKKNKS